MYTIHTLSLLSFCLSPYRVVGHGLADNVFCSWFEHERAHTAPIQMHFNTFSICCRASPSSSSLQFACIHAFMVFLPHTERESTFFPVQLKKVIIGFETMKKKWQLRKRNKEERRERKNNTNRKYVTIESDTVLHSYYGSIV